MHPGPDQDDRPGPSLTPRILGHVNRRDVLASLLAVAAAGGVAACGGRTAGTAAAPSETGGSGTTEETEETVVPSPERLTYGDDPSQFGDLYRPVGGGPGRGVVVVVHGGFWRDAYNLSLGAPLAADLAARGWTAWNLEYRRVGTGTGGGGGVPATLDDVAAGIDLLGEVDDLDLTTVVTLGHSAGGHLATWAAARAQDALSRWQPVRAPVTHVVSQAGVLDLRLAGEQALGSGAVDGFLGAPAASAGAAVDPVQQVPLRVPVWCVHGDADANVPLSQSEAYVAASRRAGGRAELVRVEGDHFTLIDTGSDAWRRTLTVLDGIAPTDSRGRAAG
ncbi:S9 family peptidase [Nocardioidaceae bacterium]|nr:S9 family peptidase [Nocardioidaceae bacterium]